ncbi:TetR/AcrR family transcriptional regulator [Agathobacter rectalis]|uniref:TetR/AcrR family transcriptional regulator n=1 Tax=Agathobacter rectalis TaxID=39491 RepID=UPI0026B18650
MATFTRKAIMQTFLHILKNKPLDRITVKDICEQCEINRNTFYYYFKDIYDVLEAIFEDEVRLVMDEAKEGVTFHDAYARVAALILNNREAIMHIYASENGRVLRTYLDAVVTQVVRRFVLEKAEATAWMIVTLLLSRRFTATESWAVQLSGLREAV